MELVLDCIFILFTMAVLETLSTETVVCPLLGSSKILHHFMQLNSKRETVLLTVINLYWL